MSHEDYMNTKQTDLDTDYFNTFFRAMELLEDIKEAQHSLETIKMIERLRMHIRLLDVYHVTMMGK